MGKPITSRFWTTFLRVWIIVPPLIWVPFVVGFFFPLRPSEAHLSYWAIVGAVEIGVLFGIVIPAAKEKFFTPTLSSWAYLALFGLMIWPGGIRKNYLSDADNWDNLVLTMTLFATIIPSLLFRSGSKKLSSSCSSVPATK